MKIQPMALVIAAACAALGGCGGGSSTPSSSPTTGGNTGANTPATYAVGGQVSGLLSGETVQLLNNNGDALPVNADGSFTFATQLAAGSPYNVTIGTQPGGASCSVSASSGTIAGTVSNVAVTCSPMLLKNIALFLDSAAGTILTYAYDAASGQLTPLAGPDLSAGAGSNGILVDASATHAYTLTPGNGTGAAPRLAAFTIGLGGVLTANGVQTLTSDALDATLDVAGDTLYVLQAPVKVGQAATIMTYPIDPSSGAVGAQVGTATVLPSTADLLYRSPVADYLYAIAADAGSTGLGDDSVTAYGIGTNGASTTGQPKPVGTAVATGIGPTAMAITPDGKYAYILNNNDRTVSIYTVGTDGSLTALGAGSPFAVPLGTASPAAPQLTAMAIDPSGQYLYINDIANGDIYQLKIDSNNGTLTALGTPPVALGTPNAGINMVGDSTGATLYAFDRNGGGVSVWTQNASTGQLSPARLSSFTFPTGTAVSTNAFGK